MRSSAGVGRHPLPEVAGPQARVLRHTAEQMIEYFVPVPMIDVPVPQMVDQLAEVVKFFFTLPVVARAGHRSAHDHSRHHPAASAAPGSATGGTVGGSASAPPLVSAISCTSSPGRRSWHWPRTLLVARGSTLVGPTGGRKVRATPSGARGRDSPPAQSGTQKLGKAEVVGAVVDVPVNMQLKLQQSLPIDILAPPRSLLTMDAGGL